MKYGIIENNRIRNPTCTRGGGDKFTGRKALVVCGRHERRV